jgi:hypothetical protein
MEKVNAVAHASDVGDHSIAENRRTNASFESGEVEHDNHEREHEVPGVSSEKPHQGPAGERQCIPDKGRRPFSASEVKIAD